MKQHTFDSLFPKIKNENSVIKKPKPISNNSNKNLDDDEFKGLALKVLTEVSKDTDRWIFFLSAISKFKGFSINNVLLIILQNMDADRLLTKSEYGHLGVTINDDAEPVRLSQKSKDGNEKFIYVDFYDSKDTDRPNLFQDEIRILDPSFLVKALEKNLKSVKIMRSKDVSMVETLRYSQNDRTIYCHDSESIPWSKLAKALTREFAKISIQAHYKFDDNDTRYNYLAESISYILCKEYGIECDFSDYTFSTKGVSQQEIIAELGKAKEFMSIQRKLVVNYSKQIHKQKGNENEK